MEAEMNMINLKRKTPDTISDDQDLIAVQILHELANTRVRFSEENNLTPLSNNVENLVTLANEAILLLASLDTPPLHLMPAIDFSSRFSKKAKAQRTIEPSCEEIRNHFRREEAIRYLVPERSFTYTTLDGKKCMVPSLKKSDKPLPKSRSHNILHRDRPSHITLCSLVIDAAARLPSGVGTKADICTLVRDSQYLVEDVSDEVMNQVVTRALNRQGLELDPCVKHKAGLWTYSYGD